MKCDTAERIRARPRPAGLIVYNSTATDTELQDGPAPRPASVRSHSIGHVALQQYAQFHLNHLNPYFPAVPGDPAVIPGSATNLQEFIEELKPILDAQQLPARAFEWIFHGQQLLTKPHPNCGGEIYWTTPRVC